MNIPLPLLNHDAPLVPLSHLDDLWFQVGGTVCNLECRHCFISCSPQNHNFGFLSLETVRQHLEQSVPLGVKEFYFTGGEPFLNRDMVPILELTLKFGPATVLTNGTVFKSDWLARLRAAESASPYSLEFRVSIDGYVAEENDPVRGEGTFERALAVVGQLVEHGFLPLITVTRTREEQDNQDLFAGFVRLLQSRGYSRPRIKILPTLHIGAECDRSHGYESDERVTIPMMQGFDADQLLCSRSRIVTDRGVHVCPILIEAPDSLLATTLHASLVDYPLRHHACYTCYQYGSLCSNPSASRRDA